jgi:hypothetical protein
MVPYLRAADDAIPAWFQPDASRPYAVFDAWKELTTRDAAICLGETWQVLAGRLQNERGQPLPNTPISISHATALRRYRVQVQTDAAGFFIVYSPYSLDLAEPSEQEGVHRRSTVTATPGFPGTPAGYAFAAKSQGFRQCKPQALLRDEERAFYVLTCNDETSFDAESFRAFEREFMARKTEPRPPWREAIRGPEGQPGERTTVRYRVCVLDEHDKPVDAIVKYQFSGIEPGVWQVRQTDAEGRCELEEWLLPRQLKGDFRADDHLMRVTTIDAPALGVGPVTLDLKRDVENVIRVPLPATVEGQVVDQWGRPFRCWLWLHYKRPAYLSFEARFATNADGTFRFDRVMPNEEFTLVTDGFDFRWRQHPSSSSEPLTLKPGEVGKKLTIQVPLAAAVRGIVVSPDGKLARESPFLDYGTGNAKRSYVGTANGPWGPSDGRFGFYGLETTPFRIRVNGWQVEPRDEIHLEPGELRFIKVVLKEKQNETPGR